MAGSVTVRTEAPKAFRATSSRWWRCVKNVSGEVSAGTIEVEIAGVTVQVGRGADAKTLMAVLRALKAGA